MKRLLYAIVAVAIIFSSCSEQSTTNNTSISGRLVGSGVDTVYLERISDEFDGAEQIGVAALEDNGAFSFDFNIEEGTSPRFYRLTFADKSRPVTLVVVPGDQITVESAGDVFLNYTVEGSEESALVAEFCHEYFTAADRLANIAENIYGKVDGRRVETNIDQVTEQREREAYNMARSAMLAQVRFVGSNQDRLAAIYALRYRIAEQYIPQLDGQGISIVHYRSVLEGVKTRYPDSPYIAILEREIADSETLSRLVEEAAVVPYPDLELSNITGKMHKLSDNDGKVVLLYFWSALNPLSNTLNADLKDIYRDYNDQGFEIYHVSLDNDRVVWVNAVNKQNLPWRTLYTGGDVRVMSLYNVEEVPTTFIITRDGDIVEVESNIKAIENEVKKQL